MQRVSQTTGNNCAENQAGNVSEFGIEIVQTQGKNSMSEHGQKSFTEISEEAIERNRLKRQREQEIAESLKTETQETQIDSKLSMFFFVRQGKGSYSWGTW